MEADIFGDDKGLEVADVLADRGKSSNFRRLSCGVGGVELAAGENNENTIQREE